MVTTLIWLRRTNSQLPIVTSGLGVLGNRESKILGIGIPGNRELPSVSLSLFGLPLAEPIAQAVRRHDEEDLPGPAVPLLRREGRRGVPAETTSMEFREQ